jgi:hypothetical protein
MKKTLIIALLVLVTTRLFSQRNAIEYCKDIMTDKEYAFFRYDLFCSNDGKAGFLVQIVLKLVDGKAVYDGIYVLSANLGTCVENSTLTFLFNDYSKITFESWNDLNCDGESYFDLDAIFFPMISRLKVDAIRFTNGRTYDSFTYKVNTNKSYFINLKKLIADNKLVTVSCD